MQLWGKLHSTSLNPVDMGVVHKEVHGFLAIAVEFIEFIGEGVNDSLPGNGIHTCKARAYDSKHSVCSEYKRFPWELFCFQIPKCSSCWSKPQFLAQLL